MDENGMPSNEEILELQKKGHTFHCAMRILTGDGECECDFTDKIPGRISAGMYAGVCPVCLERTGHKEWCRNNNFAHSDGEPYDPRIEDR